MSVRDRISLTDRKSGTSPPKDAPIAPISAPVRADEITDTGAAPLPSPPPKRTYQEVNGPVPKGPPIDDEGLAQQTCGEEEETATDATPPSPNQSTTPTGGQATEEWVVVNKGTSEEGHYEGGAGDGAEAETGARAGAGIEAKGMDSKEKRKGWGMNMQLGATVSSFFGPKKPLPSPVVASAHKNGLWEAPDHDDEHSEDEEVSL